MIEAELRGHLDDRDLNAVAATLKIAAHRLTWHHLAGDQQARRRGHLTRLRPVRPRAAAP